MIRIVGGKYKGKRLFEPENEPIRPALDRGRESLFNLLMHHFDESKVYGKRVLDAFSGTGAYGLEALSRGASFAYFIDIDKGSLALTQKNIRHLGIQDQTTTLLGDSRFLKPCSIAPFDLVILAPPYGQNLVNPAFACLQEKGWLAKNALIVVEVDSKEDWQIHPQEQFLFERTYGRNRYCFFQF